MSTQETPPAFVLPAALLSAGLRLRPETDDDLAFLLRLYGSTREGELRLVDWPEVQKQSFLSSQFEAQRHHYRNSLDGCRFEILEWDGAPVGRLYLQAKTTQLYIVDVALLPECRGRGLGTELLQALQDAAAAEDRGVGIMVEKFNLAMRLYRRLGFADVADHGVYQEMEWRRTPVQLKTA
jgi:ribosomal protein S18 acetylase RimI-like enzyme